MHIERVHFDDIFDVQAQCFSFRSAGQVRYGVHLRRGAIPPVGATYVFALSSREEWSNPIGWMDVDTGNVMHEQSTWLEVLSGLGSFLWFAPFFLGGALLLGGPGLALATLLALCCACCWRLHGVVDRKASVRKALREGDVEPARSGACGVKVWQE
jgi:hypothetical protein